jgi:kynurenine formamidase
MTTATATNPAAPRWAAPRNGAHLLERTGPSLLGGRPARCIDLTREVYEGMPIWPGHQRPFRMTNQTHDRYRELWDTERGFEAHNWLISEHTGTHSDAVFEYDPSAPTLEYTPLEYYYGEAVCVDVSHIRYPDYITEARLREALSAQRIEIKPGDIVCHYTGHSTRTWPTLAFVKNYTGLDRGAATWLCEQGVINIATDNLAIDHTDDADYQAHTVCGEYQIVNTEVLANLDQLIGQRFYYVGLPLRLRDGTGSPIRAIAWLPA